MKQTEFAWKVQKNLKPFLMGICIMSFGLGANGLTILFCLKNKERKT